MNDIHRVLNTPLGRLPARANANGIRAIGWPGSEALATAARNDSSTAAGWLDQLGAQLTAYFAGERCRFDLPITADGTPFQQAVWDALRTIPFGEIPFGETRSYGEIARPQYARWAPRPVPTRCP